MDVIPWQEMHRIDLLCGFKWDLSYLIVEKRGIKVEITVNDLVGNEAVVLSTHGDNEGAVFISVKNDDFPDYHVEVSIEDLKMALRKLSAK